MVTPSHIPCYLEISCDKENNTDLPPAYLFWKFWYTLGSLSRCKILTVSGQISLTHTHTHLPPHTPTYFSLDAANAKKKPTKMKK